MVGGALPLGVFVLVDASEACVPCTAVPGGGAYTDGIHHVRRLEV